jgi:hypothetical protein
MAMIFIVAVWLFVGGECVSNQYECLNNLPVHVELSEPHDAPY